MLIEYIMKCIYAYSSSPPRLGLSDEKNTRKPRADTRVRPCQSAGRRLCRDVRDLFLRALVVENDAGENVHRQGVMDLVEKW